VPTRYENVDLIIVRENTEDLYSGLEHEVVPGVVESLKIITARASLRIARFAFEYARREGRNRVTAIHKANIMKLTDGLFLDSARQVAAEYPDIQFDDKIVDNLAMQLVLNPNQFDVLLLSNLYGDIVSISAPVSWEVSVSCPPPTSAKSSRCSRRSTAPLPTSPARASPILPPPFSGVLMLRHLGENEAADRVLKAVFAVLKRGEVRTPDLGGKATTKEYADALGRELEAKRH
jgi:isocitrate dehydrogenase (NAD+)